jgi:predicted acetyltransferase
MADMGFELRGVTPDLFDAFSRVLDQGFGGDTSDDEHRLWFDSAEQDRLWAAFDGDRMVATGGNFSLRLTVPGPCEVAVGGLTAVSVLPTYHRHGILRAMLAHSFAQCEERGEAITVLTASESKIYGRFGFGPAVHMATYEIETTRGELRTSVAPAGNLRMLERSEIATVARPLFDRYRRGQPGEVSAPEPNWLELMKDPPWAHHGRGRASDVVYEEPSGEATGWISYRVSGGGGDGMDHGNIAHVRDLDALTPDAAVALFRYALELDLTSSVRLLARPLEDPLRWLLADPRRLRTTSVADHLWVRLLDLPTALAARRYHVPGRLVLAVNDTLRPQNQGRFLLEGSPDDARCTRTDAAPDLELDVAALGAAYLGGVRLRTLSRAGLVRELTPGAIGTADTMFASDPPPACSTAF